MGSKQEEPLNIDDAEDELDEDEDEDLESEQSEEEDGSEEQEEDEQEDSDEMEADEVAGQDEEIKQQDKPAQQTVQPKPYVKIDLKAGKGERRLIIVLERANLETVKVGKSGKMGGFELLNCDDHIPLIKKYRKDPAFCRPDITHQCLLNLFDSPLNRAGLLQVYIHTAKGVLIAIHPQTRFPRTFKRFASLMVQLLHKLTIRSNSANRHKLLYVVKNPITNHLPPNCPKIATSFSTDQLVLPDQLANLPPRISAEDSVPANPIVSSLIPAECESVCIAIGAFAHGNLADLDWADGCVKISRYPLSAALAASKIVSAFEERWGVY